MSLQCFQPRISDPTLNTVVLILSIRVQTSTSWKVQSFNLKNAGKKRVQGFNLPLEISFLV